MREGPGRAGRGGLSGNFTGEAFFKKRGGIFSPCLTILISLRTRCNCVLSVLMYVFMYVCVCEREGLHRILPSFD